MGDLLKSWKQISGGIWFPFQKDAFGCCIESKLKVRERASQRWDINPLASYSWSVLFIRVSLLVPKCQLELTRKCNIALGSGPKGFLMLAQFFWPHPQHAEVPRPGSNPCHRSDLSHSSDDARSLTPWATRELLVAQFQHWEKKTHQAYISINCWAHTK